MELAQFLNMKKSEWARFVIDDGIRGKRVDMQLMYADTHIRSNYPASSLLFESKGGGQSAEAHQERVFKLAKLTKTALRTRLSPILLSAFVRIAHNIPLWELFNGGLDFDRLWQLFKQTLNITGDHCNPGDKTDVDDENSDVDEQV